MNRTKNYFSLFLFCVLIFVGVDNLKAQCPPGDVTFTSQAALDAFIIDYPNCTEINGDLKINGSLISDLSGLSNIEVVHAHFYITFCPSLTNIDGLDNLTNKWIVLAVN